MNPNGTTKPTADYWLARDEARVSWEQLRRALEAQRGKYAAWIAGSVAPVCDRPCRAADAPQRPQLRQELYEEPPLR